MSTDYYHLAQMACLLKDEKFKNNQTIGLWSNIIYSKNDRKSYIFEQIIYLKKILLDFFLRLKWTQLYKAIGVDKVVNLRSFDILGFDYILSNKKKDFCKLSFNKIKKEKIDGIPAHENIIDTYIRFRNKPNVDFNDYYLKEILIKFTNLKKKFLKYFGNFENECSLFLNYSNYHLGILAKTALSLNFNVYTTRDASSYLKKLSKKDYTTNMICNNLPINLNFY